MPPTRTVPDPTPPPASHQPSTTGLVDPKKSLSRTRRRFWLLLVLALLISCALFPPPWQFLLAHALQWEATRRGGHLSIGRIEGGPFDTFRLYDVRYRQPGSGATINSGTDLRLARVELTPDLSTLGRNREHRPWLRHVELEGLVGRYDLGRSASVGESATGEASIGSWLSRHAARLVPTDFFIDARDFTVRRGAYQVHARQTRLNGKRNQPGFLLAGEIEINGPGFRNTFLNRHGRTAWQGDRLTVTGVDLAPGVSLATVMVDGTHLGQRRLAWNGTLAALGGEVRAQGAVNLSRTHLNLEVAGTLRALPVQSLARLLGLMGTAGGQIEQGNFSFHGDPEDWPSAEMWLAVQATDFRWGRRRWQSLELQMVVLHRRVQVNRLELRQSRNQLSVHGEFPLPTAASGGGAADPARWWEAGFSCAIDARLDDLRALTTLIGPRFPAVEGRMSVNGTLEALPGKTGINGYLNVEGSQLVVRGAPLDYLRSTLVFSGDDVKVADLQATHGSDYLSGHWITHLAAATRYEGELRIAVKDRSIYIPALGGIIDLGKLGPGAEDPQAPVQFDGTLHGPGPQGEIVFQNASTPAEPVSVAAPTVGDWWRDD